MRLGSWRMIVGLSLVSLGLVATPGVVRAQDASEPSILRHYRAYRAATSEADSVRAADSMLVASLAVLHQDSLDAAALFLCAASYGMQGDTAHALQALAQVNPVRLKPWFATSPVPSPVIDVQPIDLFSVAEDVLRHPQVRSWRLHALFFAATETLLYKLSQQHPGDPGLARAAFAVAADAEAWAHVMVSGELLRRLDGAAAGAAVGLDATFFATLLAAYDVLRLSDARWGDGTCVGDGMMCYGFTDAERARMLEQALVVAQSATERFPEARILWRGYATALRNAARPPKSDLATLLGTVLQPHANDQRFAHRLVAGFVDAGDWVGAVAVAPLDTMTDDTAYVRHMFAAYRNVGQFRQAAALAGTLIRQHPHDARFLSAVAFGCGDLEDWSCAAHSGEALARADSTVLGDRRYGILMVTAYDRLRQPQKAVALLARATTRLPQDAQLWLRYAQALRRAGQRPAAARAIVHAFQIDAGDPHVTNSAVWLWYTDELRRSGQRSLALQAVQRAAAAAPSDPSVQEVQRDIAGEAQPGVAKP